MIAKRGEGRVRGAGMAARLANAWLLVATLALAAATLCPGRTATAATKTWADGTGSWNVSGNWSPSGLPQAGDDVYLTQSDATDRTATYYNTTNPTAILNSLTIDATGLGTMTLNMPNSHTLSVTSEYVGYDGQGAVTQSTGTNNATWLLLGYNAGGNGSYTITGGTLFTGGTLPSSGYQSIGNSGTGTLSIQNGGQVSGTDGYLGFNSGSSGTVTVDGSGSKWTNSGFLYVGCSGTGTLNIQNGGEVSNTSGCLGDNSGTSGTATVDGIGSKWTNSGGLTVGGDGTGTLKIQNGGVVSNTIAWLGDGSGTNDTVTVDGIGSKWTNSEYLNVGSHGTGTLNVQNGGEVSNTTGYVGSWGGSSGRVTVDGIGSKWTNSGDLEVGWSGMGMLNIQNGGQVSNTHARLGPSSGSSGTVTVDGIGSKWTNSGDLSVGYPGTGTLNIQNGGEVSSTWGDVHGLSSTVTVDGSGSKWTISGGLSVGASGTLKVQNGGQVSCSDALDVGTGTLKIQNGGVVSNTIAWLGDDSGSSGTVTVDGSGSKWTNSEYLHVGSDGTGTLNVQNGGQVSNTYAYLGFYSGSSGTVTVDGSGSKWTNSEYLHVGYSGTGTLKIQNGGQVANTYGYFGFSGGSSGTVTVDGIGSKWANSGELHVGWYGTGTLKIQNGGVVSNTDGYLGYYSGSSGRVTVDGIGSKWTNSGFLYVGCSGTGTLNIQNGGEVSNTSGCLGDNSGTSGTATVDGSGSAWNNSGSLYVGGNGGAAGGTGSVTVRNGGQLTVGGTLKLWKADSTVIVSGGTLTAGALVGSTGIIRITDPAGGTALTVGSTASTTFSGNILDDTGPGSLTKVGTGTLSLTGVNYYTGPTTVAEGVLSVGNAWALGSVHSGTTVASGATLEVGASVTGESLTLNGPGVSSTGALRSSSAAVTWSGPIMLATDSTIAASAGHLTFSGPIKGAGSLTKSGEGLLELTASNSYTGITAIQTGTLRARDGEGLPTASNLVLAGGVFEANGSATLIRNTGTSPGQVRWVASGGFSAYDGKLTVAIGGTASPTPLRWGTGGFVPSGFALVLGSTSANNEVELRNNIDLGGWSRTITVNDNPESSTDFATISGVISNGSLTKDGVGTLVVSGSNTYAGATTVAQGVLSVGNALALGSTASGTTVANGATLEVGASVTGEALTLTGVGVGGRGALRGGSVPVTWNGPITPTVDLGVFVGASAAPLTISGKISGGLEKVDTGLVVLTGANTYTLSTVIDGGALRANDAAGLPTASNLVLNGGVFESSGLATFTRGMGTGAAQVRWMGSGGFSASGGKLTVAIGGTGSPTALTWSSGYFWPGSTLVFGSSWADSETAFCNSINLGGATRTITVNDNSGIAADFATLSGVLSNGGLIKAGPGTLVLSGNNTYTLSTVIDPGALRANDAAGLPNASNLVLNGGVFESSGLATFTRGMGMGAAQVCWTGSGGFSASGGKLTVAIGGTGSPTALTWNSGYFVPSGSTLVFGSSSADSETEFRNSINFGGATRTITANDNSGTTTDFATLSGVLSNGGLIKAGPGTLVLSGNNTYGGDTRIRAGTVFAASGGALGASSVKLGDTTGSSDAALLVAGAYTVYRPITVQDDGSPTSLRTLGGTSTAGAAVFSGDITLEKDLTLTAAPGGTVRFDGVLDDSEGHTINKIGEGIVVLDGVQVYGPGALLDVEAGILDLNTDAGANLSITVTDAVVNFGSNQHLDMLTIGDGGTVRFTGAHVVVLNHLVMGGMDLGATALTPEPATFSLLALGGLALLRRRRAA